jgi:hypothetical protein
VHLDPGLAPRDQPDYSRQALADIKLAQERCARLQAQALPVMEMLLDQVSGSGQVVCLADDKGTILLSAGRGASLEFAERVALRPGCRGPNRPRARTPWARPWSPRATSLSAQEHHRIQPRPDLLGLAHPGPPGGVIGVLDLTGEPQAFHPTPWAWCACRPA